MYVHYEKTKWHAFHNCFNCVYNIPNIINKRIYGSTKMVCRPLKSLNDR